MLRRQSNMLAKSLQIILKNVNFKQRYRVVEYLNKYAKLICNNRVSQMIGLTRWIIHQNSRWQRGKVLL